MLYLPIYENCGNCGQNLPGYLAQPKAHRTQPKTHRTLLLSMQILACYKNWLRHVHSEWSLGSSRVHKLKVMSRSLCLTSAHPGQVTVPVQSVEGLAPVIIHRNSWRQELNEWSCMKGLGSSLCQKQQQCYTVVPLLWHHPFCQAEAVT